MAMASLNASLLARKGTARPVTRPATQNTGSYASSIQFLPQSATQTARSTATDTSTYQQGRLDKNSATTNHPKDSRNSTNKERTRASRRKSVRLTAPTDKDLRLLAASLGVSQQSIMEKAIADHIARIYRERGCVCGSKNQAVS